MNGLVGRTIGHYRILEQVGQGGMSSVFRAVDLLTNRTVAVKVLSPYLANESSFQVRFEREVRLLRQLRHPNIIPILDTGEAEGLAYIVMPFLATGTLHERLMKGPLDPVLGGKIVDQLASALAYAHERGVIHRDVKPSNVLLDESGNAVLSDFSFARLQETSQNLTGSALIGTPAYMSPEQCRGEPITVRSDQYSFAVLLFQIATGQLPFDGETPMAVAIKHVNVPLPRPREVNPHLPEGVERVLIRALAKDPALRFDSVKDLNAAFQAELHAALDPRYRAASDRTARLDRTQELYQRYQNVKPTARKPSARRPTLVATLLLLMACAVSAAAIGIVSPEIFRPASAAARTVEVDIQSTVDALLTAQAPGEGTAAPAGGVETAVYAAVLQTLQSRLTAEAGLPQATAPGGTAAEGGNGAVLGPSSTSATWTEAAVASTASPSSTQARTSTPALATKTATRTPLTPSPTRTVSPPTATTSSVTSTSAAPSATSAAPTFSGPSPSETQTLDPTQTSSVPSQTATLTSVPPTATALPPTATVPPPTSTLAPPTATSPPQVCDWDVGGETISGDTVSVVIHNNGNMTLHVSGVGISWTDSSEHLIRVRLGTTIWSGWDSAPDFYVGTSRSVTPGGSRTLEFEYWGSHFSGSASVHVDADC